MRGNGAQLNGIVFSADGTRLLAGGEYMFVGFWDADSGNRVVNLDSSLANELLRDEREVDIVQVAVSSDGANVAALNSDGTVIIWSASTGAEIHRLSGQDVSIISVAFVPDSGKLLTGATDGWLLSWDVDSGQETGRRRLSFGTANRILFSSDGASFAVIGSSNRIAVFDTETLTEAFSFEKTEGSHRGIAFSSDLSRMATLVNNNTIKIRDIAPAAEVIKLAGSRSGIRSIVFAPNGGHIAVSTMDWGESDNFVGNLNLWSISEGQVTLQYAENKGEISSVSFSPDSKLIATGVGVDGPGVSESAGIVRVFDTESGRQLTLLEGHDGPIESISFSPNGKHIATGSADGNARLWAVETGQELFTIPGDRSIGGLSFSPDGARLAVGDSGGVVRLWNLANDSEEASLKTTVFSSVASLNFSGDANRLAILHDNGVVRIWDIELDREIAITEPVGSRLNVDLSPDWTRLATGSPFDGVSLWDLATSSEIQRVGQFSAVELDDVVAFSPDGSQLATSTDRDVLIWDLSGVPAGNAFSVVSKRLPKVNGRVNCELSGIPGASFVSDGIPICGKFFDPPSPWWVTPGAVEPGPR